MQARAQIPIWLLVLNLALAAAVGVLMVRVWLLSESGLPSKEMAALRLVYKEVFDQHVDPQDGAQLMNAAIGGLVKSTDKFSEFVPAARVQTFEEQNSGTYQGIGAVVVDDRDVPLVLYPLPGGPAARAGFAPGDLIVAIDGKDVPARAQRTQRIYEQLRGRAGTTVAVLVRRGAREPVAIAVERGAVHEPSVRWARILDAAAGIGYVHMSGFQDATVDELDAALSWLAREGMRALILDLRDNSGGLLEKSILIANRFLAEGVVVTLKRRAGIVEAEHRAKAEHCRWPTLPLVLLQNESSASASEVLAGALQDHARARIVGTRSYGKAVVQSIFRWADRDFRLKLTTAHYFTPKGRDIHGPPPENGAATSRPRGGIAPDVQVALPTEPAALVSRGLGAREVPRDLAEAVRAVAAAHKITITEPLPPAQDAQLARALEEARVLLVAASRPTSEAGSRR